MWTSINFLVYFTWFSSSDVHHFRAIFSDVQRIQQKKENRNKCDECIAYTHTHTFNNMLCNQNECMYRRRWIANIPYIYLLWMFNVAFFPSKKKRSFTPNCYNNVDSARNWKHEQTNIYCAVHLTHSPKMYLRWNVALNLLKSTQKLLSTREHSSVGFFLFRLSIFLSFILIFFNGHGNVEWRIDLAICFWCCCFLLVRMTWNKLENHARSQINGADEMCACVHVRAHLYARIHHFNGRMREVGSILIA